MTTFGSRLSTCYRVLQKERLLTYGVDSPGQSRGISPLQGVGRRCTIYINIYTDFDSTSKAAK